MKNLKSKNSKAFMVFPLCLMLLSFFVICCDDEIEPQSTTSYPPKADIESSFTAFYPDSGGLGTKLIIKGTNLGTDTNYVRVTVNNLKAKVVGVKDTILYAVVPSRADTGYVRLYVKKGENETEYVSNKEFNYLFKSNVSTLIGQAKTEGTENGTYTEAKLRRPWQIITDNDGVIYWVDEGRGTSSNGALRRAYDGLTETLVTNNTGPFQSPTQMAFSLTQDTLFIANMYNAADVKNDVSVMYATREAGFVNFKALVEIPRSSTSSVAVHPKTGEIFFDHNDEGAVYKYDKNEPNACRKMFNVRGTYNGMVMRLLFNKEGDILYLILRAKHCIYKVTYDAVTGTFGTPEPFVGEWGTSGYQEGVGLAARFYEPSSPCLDPEGNLMIPDKKNHCIRKITPEGVVSLYAGLPMQSGYADGLPDKAQFYEPECVTFYDNTMYVADRGNHLIRKVVIE